MGFAWSYSALTSFETCPRKHAEIKIMKSVRDFPNKAGEEGKRLHKSLELYVSNGKKVPVEYEEHQKFVDGLMVMADHGAEIFPERKLALTRDLDPCEFFARNVWVRAIIDLGVVYGDTMVVVDYKTGRIPDVPDYDQIQLCAAMLSPLYPQVENFVGTYYWTKLGAKSTEAWSKEEILGVWDRFAPRVDRMEKALKAKRFPELPNGLCRNYCPVVKCQHNGE